MPRSGTSLVTQLLHRCGLDLGPPDQLMPASINNPDGYWENLQFVRFNERLLAANGGTWFAPPAALTSTPELAAEARSIVAQFQEPWGWKDPRNAVTLSFWRSILPSMKVLVCIRHPAQTASSLVASTLMPRSWQLSWSVTRPDSPIRLRDRPSRFHQRLCGAIRTSMSVENRRQLIYEVGLELWRVYNTKILEETVPGDRLVTHYEAVLKNPYSELERILNFAEIHASSAVIREAAQVVSPRLWHQRTADAELNPELAMLYAQLSNEAKS